MAPGFSREELQGLLWEAATEAELREGLEKAFDYRGDITITTKNGEAIEGYLFDRHHAPSLAGCYVRLYPKDSDQKITIFYADVAGLAFTGRDTAAGKSWEAWVKKYWEKKLAGETGIELTPDKLD